ncbi:MAG TPA: Ig-like domain-containing protein, partial [Acidimicrobiales bacterium]
GVEVCSYLAVVGGAPGLDGTIEVVEGTTTEVLVRGKRPAALTGRATVGKKVSVDWSEGMQNMIDYFTVVAGGVYNPTVQWLRDAKPIAGATDPDYRPGAADAGRTVSARVTYPPLAAAQFEQVTGQPVTPRTTNGLEVAKVATQAFATVADPTVSAGRQGRVRVDVTAPGQIVTGRVKVTVGDWSQTRSLRNGTARVILPRLAPGRHSVAATYLGTAVYASSTARPKSVTVTR